MVVGDWWLVVSSLRNLEANKRRRRGAQPACCICHHRQADLHNLLFPIPGSLSEDAMVPSRD